MALDPAVFLPSSEFVQRMDELIARLKALETAPGFDEVRYPGERGARLAEERRVNGIPVPDPTLEELRELGRRMDIPFPT